MRTLSMQDVKEPTNSLEVWEQWVDWMRGQYIQAVGKRITVQGVAMCWTCRTDFMAIGEWDRYCSRRCDGTDIS